MSGFRAFIESLRKRRQGFVRLFVLVLVNAAVFAGVTHRLGNKQERLSEERERLEAEVQQKKEELARLTQTGARVQRNAEVIQRFWTDTVQPRVPGLTEAWDEIDRLAAETNVLRGRTGFDRELLEVGLEQIKATLPLEGNYFDLVRFINRLERSERFFLVEQIRIAQRESDTTTIHLDCVVSFYLKSGADAASAGGGAAR